MLLVEMVRLLPTREIATVLLTKELFKILVLLLELIENPKELFKAKFNEMRMVSESKSESPYVNPFPSMLTFLIVEFFRKLLDISLTKGFVPLFEPLYFM